MVVMGHLVRPITPAVEVAVLLLLVQMVLAQLEVMEVLVLHHLFLVLL